MVYCGNTTVVKKKTVKQISIQLGRNGDGTETAETVSIGGKERVCDSSGRKDFWNRSETRKKITSQSVYFLRMGD